MELYGKDAGEQALVNLALELFRHHQPTIAPQIIDQERRRGSDPRQVVVVMFLVNPESRSEHEARVALAPLDELLADFPLDGERMKKDVHAFRSFSTIVGLFLITQNLEDALPFVFRLDWSGKLLES